MFLLLSVLAVALVLYWKVFRPVGYWKRRGVPHATTLPIVGSFPKVALGLSSVAEESQKHYNSLLFSNVIGIHMFNKPLLMLKDPELIKSVAIKNFDHFVDHMSLLFTDVDDPLMTKHLFSLNGDKWRSMRATLSPTFTGSKMRGMHNFMLECGEQCVDFYMEEYRKQGNGKPFDVNLETIFTRYANDIIASIAFGIRTDSCKDPKNPFFVHGQEITELKVWRIFMINIAPIIMKILGLGVLPGNLCQFFRGVMKQTLATREKENILRPDMIHLLMQAKKGQLTQEEPDQDKAYAIVQESDIGKSIAKTALTDEDITAQAIIFFIGGFQTSSSAMSFASYELAVNPDIQKRLQKEIDDTLHAGGGKLTYEALQNMHYLDMILSETLRKWPPGVQLDRKCTKPFTLKSNTMDIQMEPDMVVAFPVFAIHRDPKYYPFPDKFDPERFNEENKAHIEPFTYMPFGIGPRNCIGSRFAIMETKIILVELLKKFDIVVTEKSHVPLVIKKSASNLTSHHGYWFGLQPRNNKI